jgi:putative transposase
MSLSTSLPFVSSSFDIVRRSFLHSSELPVSDALTSEHIRQAFEAEKISFGVTGDQPVWTMATTVWGMISQALFTGKERSCRAAVIRIAVYFALFGVRVSTNTGNYCRARAKVGEAVMRRLAKGVAERSQTAVPQDWKWLGMTVKIADGTDFSMPDTPANQKEYPQSKSQAEGLGFPLMRAVALISLATGMVTDMAEGPQAGKETGETALFRKLFEGLQPGEVVLADRYYSGWFMLALLQRMGVHFAVRMHQLRKLDFSLGRRLGSKDHIVSWSKPQRPDWMDQETYDQLPDELEVRETHISVSVPGFRTESIVVVSSFLTKEVVRQSNLAYLYRQRWRAELHLREIKSTMELDILRAQTPGMVRQELWTGILTYNLIRHSMMQSALAAEKRPAQLSFAAASQMLTASWLIASLPRGTTISSGALIQLRNISGGSHHVGNRPDRVEPRAIKRCDSSHDLLTIPRKAAIAKLLSGASV